MAKLILFFAHLRQCTSRVKSCGAGRALKIRVVISNTDPCVPQSLDPPCVPQSLDPPLELSSSSPPLDPPLELSSSSSLEPPLELSSSSSPDLDPGRRRGAPRELGSAPASRLERATPRTCSFIHEYTTHGTKSQLARVFWTDARMHHTPC